MVDLAKLKIRYLTRLITFIIINLGFTNKLKSGIVVPFFFCHGCPLASTGCPIGIIQYYLAMNKLPLYPIGLILTSGLIMGRASCGLLCPFGAFQSLIDYFTKKFKIKISIKKRDLVKLICLTIVLYIISLSFIFKEPTFCKICPCGTLFATFPWYIMYPSLPIGIYFYAHILSFTIFIILLILLGRYWCKYVCPLRLLGYMNNLSILTIKLDLKKCNHCNYCLIHCPMNIRKVEDIGKSSDCVLCGICIEKCKYGALKYELRF